MKHSKKDNEKQIPKRGTISIMNKRVIVLISSFTLLIFLTVYFINSEYKVFGKVNELMKISKENEKLRPRIEGIDELKMTEKIVEQENEEYKKLVSVKKQLENTYNLELGTIIKRDVREGWYENVYINIGKKQGVKKNMAVVDYSKGLIGKIVESKNNISLVKLITTKKEARSIQVPAVVEESTVKGMISGYDNTNKQLSLIHLPMDAKIEKEDMVYTSNESSIYPRGLPIGVVESVKLDEYGLTQRALIKPTSSFDNMNDVFVITGQRE